MFSAWWDKKRVSYYEVQNQNKTVVAKKYLHIAVWQEKRHSTLNVKVTFILQDNQIHESLIKILTTTFYAFHI